MIIKEFLPNPVGNDKEGEYIKLFNDSDSAVNLSGWQIKDASGKSFKLSGGLAGWQELSLPYSQTKISLNNNGEKLFLYDATGKLVDELGYTESAREGEIIGRGRRTEERKTIEQLTNKPGEATSKSIQNNQLLNYPITNNSITNNLITEEFLFITFLTAAILAGLGLYIILQLEKKLEIKLF